MAQKPFIAKSGELIRLAEIKRVQYKKVMKVYDHIDMPGFGRVPVSKETGKVDKTHLELWTDGMAYSCEATHDGVKAKIRRLREQEAARLDAIDAELNRLRAERQSIIKQAWERGNVVTVKELVERIKS